MTRPTAEATRHAGRRAKPVTRLVEVRGHYPVWSIKSIAWLSVLTLACVATIVAVSGERSLIVELEWTLGVVAAALFALLAVGLYRGARLRETQAPAAELTKVDLSDWQPDVSTVPDFDCPLDIADGGGDELGCLGVIVGALLAIIAFVLFAGLLWAFLQFAAIVIFIVMTAIYWVLHLRCGRCSRTRKTAVGSCCGAWGSRLCTRCSTPDGCSDCS